MMMSFSCQAILTLLRMRCATALPAFAQQTVVQLVCLVVLLVLFYHLRCSWRKV